MFWLPYDRLLRADDTFGTVDTTVWRFEIDYPTTACVFAWLPVDNYVYD